MEKQGHRLESIINLPARIELHEGQPIVISDLISDCSVLNCGCLISESLANSIANENGQFRCPICKSESVGIISSVSPLRELYQLVEDLRKNDLVITTKDKLQHQYQSKSRRKSTSKRSQSTAQNQGTSGTFGNQNKIGLLSLFYQIAKDEDDNNTAISTSYTSSANQNINSVSPSNVEDWIATMGDSTTFSQPNKSNFLTKTNTSISLISNVSVPTSIRSSASKSNLTKQFSDVVISPKDENREYNFVKCFPMYRKQYQFNTHPKFFKPRAKLFIGTGISTDLKTFVLLGEKKWELYHLPSDPKTPPILKCCGKSTGEYGINFENMVKYDDPLDAGISKEEQKRRLSWEHLYCALSKKYLVIAGTKGMLRVFDIENGGVPVYSYYSNFPIRCIDISHDETLIACGITGKERVSGAEQTLIVLHQVLGQENKSLKVDSVTITLPYRDPINTLNFSSDSEYLSCSTALESRFMVISVKNRNEPRLVMKSLRSLDTSLESEGITGVQFFPNNKLMAIASVAFNAPPIIIKTRIDSIDGVQEIAQPVMLMRVDEVGSTIHKVAVSPRGDSVAFLDRNGMIFLLTAPGMDHENKRVVLVAEVANAYRMRESASLRFSDDGHRLYAVDRKGILYIQDFAAGLPQDHDVLKCKVITN